MFLIYNKSHGFLVNALEGDTLFWISSCIVIKSEKDLDSFFNIVNFCKEEEAENFINIYYKGSKDVVVIKLISDKINFKILKDVTIRGYKGLKDLNFDNFCDYIKNLDEIKIDNLFMESINE